MTDLKDKAKEIYLKMNSYSNCSEMNGIDREWILKKIENGLKEYHKSELEKISNEILNSETEIINSPIRFNGVGISTIKHVFKEHGVENKQIF